MNSEFATLSDQGEGRFYAGTESVCRLGTKRGTNESYLAINAVGIVRVVLYDVYRLYTLFSNRQDFFRC